MSSLPPGQAFVFFSTADWCWPYWTNKQHIAARLGARGFRVLYVESTGLRLPGTNTRDLVRIVRRLRRAMSPIEQVQNNVWVLSPLTIPGLQRSSLAARFNDRQLLTGVKSWLRSVRSGEPIVWTYHPYMLRVAKEIDPKALIYHCVDNLGALPNIDSATFDAAERELIACSDRIFTTSPELRDRCGAVAPDRTYYFGNVTDLDHFAAARRPGPIAADIAAIPQPRLGYVGVLSDFKTDFAVIETTARNHPNWHFVFIGDERAGQTSEAIARLKTRANVHFLGWKPYAELPSYLRAIDVALLPQLLNDYTRAMFPMKYFEYLAAGRPVVTTKLPALAEFSNLHREADGSDAFADAIASALSAPNIVPLDHPALRSHSWQARIDALLGSIAESIAPPSGEVAHSQDVHETRV
jgi:glycosyltransferase involved in cell wall biosynthesis